MTSASFAEELLIERPALNRLELLRRQLGAKVVDNIFYGASIAGRYFPMVHPRLHGVEVLKDIPYLDSGLSDHHLDVYRPKQAKGRLPIVVYVHGGGFRFLSKDTHWGFGLMFARRGYLVFNISYRTQPHQFPSAIQDSIAAYQWVIRNAERYGGDLSRIALAGESAGGNLVTSMALAAAYRRPEPWAAPMFELPMPKAVLPACGVLQVSDPERFNRKQKISSFNYDRIAEVTDAYLHGIRVPKNGGLDLADPLVALERKETPHRPLPAFFAGCGTWDFLIDDTRRLKTALDGLGVTCEARYYERELHAFHAFLISPNARRYWKHAYDFLGRHL